MAKINLNNITNPQSVSVMNANFQKIAVALDEQVLYRDNIVDEPNQMENDQDMNGKRIYNLPVPVAAHEPMRKADAELIVTEFSQPVIDAANAATEAAASAQEAADEANASLTGIQTDVNTALDASAAAVSSVNSLSSGLSANTGGSLVGFIQNKSNSVARTLQDKAREIVSVKDFGAVGDGTTADDVAFQRAVNAAAAGTNLTVVVPDGVYRINGTVTPVAGKSVSWEFSPGASLNGAGIIPYHKQAMAWNSSPNIGKRRSIWHGTDASPTTDGVIATDYVQRVDQSVTGDNPGQLISARYTTFKRLAGGTGWLYGTYSYVEDHSNTNAAQTVGVAGVAHSMNNASVWGLYGEAHLHTNAGHAVGSEVNAYNFSGVNQDYNVLDPLGGVTTKGLWSIGFGNHRNTIAIGIGAGSVAAQWGAGIFMAQSSVKSVGIDIHAQPPTLIRFRNGASVDGAGATPGGCGIDFGKNAFYGTGPGQGAMNIWEHRITFGPTGLGAMYFDAVTGRLNFYYNGAIRGHIDMGGTDHAM